MDLKQILILLEQFSKRYYNDIYMSIHIDMYEYGEVIDSANRLVFVFNSIEELIKRLSR